MAIGMTQKGSREESRLDGWKEIATFLGRSVRTVQMWEEEHGLPVYREMKRVWALPAEITAWRESHQDLPARNEVVVPEPARPAPIEAAPPTTHLQWRKIAAAAVVLVGCSGLLGVVWNRPGPPADYHARGPVLSVVDASQKAVWSHTFSGPLNEEVRSGQSALLNLRGRFVDLDQDGHQEFLYRHWPLDLSKENSALFCFRTDGSVRWSFAPGRPALKLADGRVISGTYTVSHVSLLRHPRKDGGLIVVASNHSWDWPQQVAILNAEGKLVDEYWHPGWFFTLDVSDLDDDGRDEILLGGVNGAYSATDNRSATLVVLDADDIRGQGSVPPESRLKIAGLPVYSEKRVLLFSEFAKHPNPNHYGHIERISAQPDRSVQLVVSQGFGASIFGEPYAHLQLDPQLNVTRVLPGAELMDMLAARYPTVTSAEDRAKLYRKVVADILELPRRSSSVASR